MFIPLKSITLILFWFKPTAKTLGCPLNHANEFAVSEIPNSATGFGNSTAAWALWCELFEFPIRRLEPFPSPGKEHLLISHKSIEWSALILSSPAAKMFGSRGFHATALHCRACLGTKNIID